MLQLSYCSCLSAEMREMWDSSLFHVLLISKEYRDAFGHVDHLQHCVLENVDLK